MVSFTECLPWEAEFGFQQRPGVIQAELNEPVKWVVPLRNSWEVSKFIPIKNGKLYMYLSIILTTEQSFCFSLLVPLKQITAFYATANYRPQSPIT